MTYDFNPKPDITVQELASIMRSLFVGMIQSLQSRPADGKENLEIEDLQFSALDASLQRHFDKQS